MSGRDDEQGRYPVGNPHQWRPEESNNNNEVPVDLAAVQADDALLDMLGSGAGALADADAELTRVLVAWRRDVDTEPIPELVDPVLAGEVISAARRPPARRHRVLGPVAVAAAVLVIAFSGTGLAAKSAKPGDQLFGLTKVLYSEYARSAEAAQKVETELAEAETAINQGDTAKAKESLAEVQQQLTVIADTEGRTRLAAKHEQLEEQLMAGIRSPAETSTPTAPPPVPTSTAPVQPPPVQASTTAPPTSQTSPENPPPTTTPPPSPTPTT
ncbi:MAG TPA: anti-sigma-D factor RsdA, partial [Pseudonocardiaceae bacterium]|nr:anti-sigma-D factor RsdA [Pseudonocardiaceae bacterium]